jgi:hypothetical protein
MRKGHRIEGRDLTRQFSGCVIRPADFCRYG